jgi:hypothetical protein
MAGVDLVGSSQEWTPRSLWLPSSFGFRSLFRTQQVSYTLGWVTFWNQAP